MCLTQINANLLAVNHLLTWNRTQQNISTRIYATTVSSMNVTGSDKVFIFRERSFVYIMKSKGPRITPRKFCDLLSHSQKKNFWVSLDHFISALWFPSVKYDVKKCAIVPWRPQKCNLANIISWFTIKKPIRIQFQFQIKCN